VKATSERRQPATIKPTLFRDGNAAFNHEAASTQFGGCAGFADLDRLAPFVLPVQRHIGTGLVQVNVLIDVVDPRQRNEVMVLAVG
jgi:hypothetical protein